VSARGTWLFLVVGAVIGLVLGILVSVTTDVPFAPEVGLVLGALVGWLSRRSSEVA
jgi:hypothetical protein